MSNCPSNGFYPFMLYQQCMKVSVATISHSHFLLSLLINYSHLSEYGVFYPRSSNLDSGNSLFFEEDYVATENG